MGIINPRDRAAPPLKTARRPPHSLSDDRDYRGLGLSCWLIHKKHRLRVTAKDARLPPLTRYRLHAAPGSISAKGRMMTLHDVEGLRRAKCHPVCKIFFFAAVSGMPQPQNPLAPVTFYKPVDCVRQNVIPYGRGRMKRQIRRENVKGIACT
jgi:hypothetical protein